MSQKNIAIKSPDLLNILKNIRQIWHRLNDDDVKCLPIMHQLDKISREHDDFGKNHEKILTSIVLADGTDARIKALSTIISVIYYKEKERQGLVTEGECSEMLTNKFFPENLKNELRQKMSAPITVTEMKEPVIIERK